MVMPSTVQAFVYPSTDVSTETTQSFVGAARVVVVVSMSTALDVVVPAGGSVVTGDGTVVEDVVASVPPPVQAPQMRASAITVPTTFDMRRELTDASPVLA
jgi:hypothetical protein